VGKEGGERDAAKTCRRHFHLRPSHRDHKSDTNDGMHTRHQTFDHNLHGAI
jgi:hypothetical protein